MRTLLTFGLIFQCSVGMPTAAQEATPSEQPAYSTTPIRLGETPAEQELREKLLADTSLDFVEAPLKNVLKHIEAKHDIQVKVDRQSLDDLGITLDVPISIQAQGIPLRHALELTLEDVGLDYAISAGKLLITAEESEEPSYWVMYPVGDLSPSTDTGDFPHAELIEVLMRVVHALSWDEVGGSGEIVPFRDLLIIHQTETIHNEINDLFAALRSHFDRSSGSSGANYDPTPIRIGEGVKDEVVRKKLTEPTAFRFSKTPLEEALASLAEQHDVRIDLNRSSLSDLGISPDVPVTLKLTDVSLRSALELILPQLDLTYLVDSGRLLIESIEESEDRKCVVIYPLGDLIGSNRDQSVNVFDELIVLIVCMVNPTSWGEMTGPGEIAEFRDLLILPQTEKTHNEIINLLTGLRKVSRVEQ